MKRGADSLGRQGPERAETVGMTFREGDWLTAFIESYRDRTTALYSIRRHDLQ
jgi:hypothetical protein